MSIGSKFAIVALILPICLILVVLAISYSVYPNPFLLALVAALPSATVFIWRELRSTLQDRMIQVWDNNLKPIRDREAEVALGTAYHFPDYGWGLVPKMEWVVKYGKYGRIKLYPKTLTKNVPELVSAGEDFNSKLDEFLATTGAINLRPEPYFAFDHWGLRRISPEEMKRQGEPAIVAQKRILDTLDKTKMEEIVRLTHSWERALSLAKQTVSILDRFSSENGIVPPKAPTLFGGAYLG